MYTYRVSWSEEDAEFVATCAEFPGLSWLDHGEDIDLRDSATSIGLSTGSYAPGAACSVTGAH